MYFVKIDIDIDIDNLEGELTFLGVDQAHTTSSYVTGDFNLIHFGDLTFWELRTILFASLYASLTHFLSQVKAMLQQLLAKFSLESNPELEAKNTALAKDPALFQLYKDLVSSGLISADEFWSNRLGGGSSREEGATTEQQESGLPSAFLVSECASVCV